MTPLQATLQDVLVHLRSGRWNEAHQLVQQDSSPLGAWLHGIVHIVEGDLEDAEYWYGQAGRHFRSRGTLEEELASFEVVLLHSEGSDPAPVTDGPHGT